MLSTHHKDMPPVQRLAQTLAQAIHDQQLAAGLLLAVLAISLCSPFVLYGAGGRPPLATERAAETLSVALPGARGESAAERGWARIVRVLAALITTVSALRLLWLWLPGWLPPPPAQASLQTVAFAVPSHLAWATVSRAAALAGVGLHRSRHCESELGIVERARLARWLPGLVYFGVVLLALAGLIRDRFGAPGQPLSLTVGETRPVPGQADLSLGLDQIAITGESAGAAGRIDSQVRLLLDDRRNAVVTVQRGQPARGLGFSVYQLGSGPAVRVTARAPDGRLLRIHHLVGAVPAADVMRVAFEGQQGEELLAVPEADLVLRIVYYASLPAKGLMGQTLHIQALEGRSRTLLAERFLSGPDQLVVRDTTLSLVLEPYVTLQVQREPHLPVAAAGGLCILAGIIAHVVWPPLRAWVAFEDGAEGHGVCVLLARPSETQLPWFRCFVALLAEGARG